MLDASKAFDRVNLFVLFLKLYAKGLTPSYVRFFNGFIQRTKYSVSNGVKQGGVLSPIIFSLYLDKLLVELRELGIGCHMNGLFTGAFSYADDITSIGPSCYALNSMLNVCEEYD